MQRSPAPVDKEIYLYSQFETADAQRVFACFDQPDLKSVFTWHVTVPAHWRVVSSGGGGRAPPARGGGENGPLLPSARVGTHPAPPFARAAPQGRGPHAGLDPRVVLRASTRPH